MILKFLSQSWWTHFLSQPWWSGISGVTGTIAMFGALATVIYSVRAIKNADAQARRASEQSQEYLHRLDEQTSRLTVALLRPEIRVIRTDKAIQAINREKSLNTVNGRPAPDVWVAITNVGLAVAKDIEFGWTSESDDELPDDSFSMIGFNSQLIIPARDDIQVIAFELYPPNDHRVQAGFIHLEVRYFDLVGTKYRYRAKLRYAGSGNVAGLAEDSTEEIQSDF